MPGCQLNDAIPLKNFGFGLGIGAIPEAGPSTRALRPGRRAQRHGPASERSWLAAVQCARWLSIRLLGDARTAGEMDPRQYCLNG